MSLVPFYDSVDPARIPARPRAVFGYANGKYAWPAATIAAFRKEGTIVRLIDVNGTDPRGAHVVDVEAGDVSPAGAHQWITARHAAGKVATIYVSLSSLPALLRACAGKSYHLWIAKWDGTAALEQLHSLPSGVVLAGHQYATHPNYDLSVMSAAWVQETA